MTKARAWHYIIHLMEMAGWITLLANSHGPMAYGVLLLWVSSILRRASELK